MIKAKIISEVVGSPQEHVNKTLNLILEKLKERNGINIDEERLFEAQIAKNQNENFL